MYFVGKNVAILFNEDKKTFTLNTKNSTYQMQIGEYGHLLHLYYGKKAEGTFDYILNLADRGFSGNPYEADNDRNYSMDVLPQEYPTQGTGDFRITALNIKNIDGTYCCDLRYERYETKKGKYKLPELPAFYSDESEGETLIIYMKDITSGIEVAFYYGIFEELDMITRASKITNTGTGTIVIEKALSACIDIPFGDFDLMTFYGRHAMERITQRVKLSHGIHKIGSKRGTSSHEYNPFLILADDSTTEEHGACYGMQFVYSGNFTAEVEFDQYNQTRMMMGIQDELFAYELESGEEFYTPEVAINFSYEGLAKLSQNYHKAIRNNLCRGKYKKIPRPVLINNWEATYFDFDGQKIVDIAKKASELGVEMLVLDDGWFGTRNDDLQGLGDWYVNETKIGGSLSDVVKKINDMGMKFGIWMEPEMVNENSDLYREHPDWAIIIPGRKPVRSRYQLVLDFTRKEVVDNIYEQMCKVLDHANIEYLKWDMNRSICDVYSATLPKEKQGAFYHKFVLGVYDLLERILTRYPNMMIEGCSGGGGRFDAGMMYYTPQIWCSDNTDAIDRLSIQYGTSFAYPISTVGSHVSASPNHQTGRTTTINTRGVVAMSGSFGYELDLNKISEEEKQIVKEQIDKYHLYWHLVNNGDYYRLSDINKEKEFVAWGFVAEDKQEALLNVITTNVHGNGTKSYVKLRGLDENTNYYVKEINKSYSGSALMNVGLLIPIVLDEYQAWQVHFTKEI